MEWIEQNVNPQVLGWVIAVPIMLLICWLSDKLNNWWQNRK